MKKGWPQSLDNGVMIKPSIPGPQKRQGHSVDFFGIIGQGENESGQITLSPGEVTQGGKCIYEQETYPRNLHGKRWNKPRDY